MSNNKINIVLIWCLMMRFHSVPVDGKLRTPFRAIRCLLMAMKLELNAVCVSIPVVGMFCEAAWEVSRSNLSHVT